MMLYQYKTYNIYDEARRIILQILNDQYVLSLFPQDMRIIKNDIMNSMTENKQILCTIINDIDNLKISINCIALCEMK